VGGAGEGGALDAQPLAATRGRCPSRGVGGGGGLALGPRGGSRRQRARHCCRACRVTARTGPVALP
jgi:hypothetical protein